MSRVCLRGRTAAGHAGIPLGPGRRPVSSLAGISPLFCYAPTDRVDLPSLWSYDSAQRAILLLVRKSPAHAGFGESAIGTAAFGVRFDDHSLSGSKRRKVSQGLKGRIIFAKLNVRAEEVGTAKKGRDTILDNLQPSLRDSIMFHLVPRPSVLG